MPSDRVDELVNELAGYEKIMELAPDVAALTILRNQDVVFYIAGVVSVLLAGAVIWGIATAFLSFDHKKIGSAFVTGVLTAILITPVSDETIYIKTLDVNVDISNQPAAQLYLYKGLHNLTLWWNSVIDRMVKSVMNGEPSHGIQRILTDHYSDSIMEMDGADELRRIWAHYVTACEGIARHGIDIGEITAAEAGSIGLFGGSGLGLGYYFGPQPLGEDVEWMSDYGGYFTWSTPVNTVHQGRTLSSDLLHNVNIQPIKASRSKAARFVWDRPAAHAPALPEGQSNYYPIYNRDYWVVQLAKADGMQDQISGLNPDVIDVDEHPFSEILKNPNPPPFPATPDEMHQYETHAYLNTCRKYYVAAESALTAYYDAIFDYTAFQKKLNSIWRWGAAPQTVEEFRSETRSSGEFTKDMHIANISLSRSKNTILKRLSASTLEDPNGDDTNPFNGFQAFVEGTMLSTVSSFEEWKNKFGIMGGMSLHIMLISLVYVSTPIFFLMANFFGIETLVWWVKTFVFAFLSLIISVLVLALGMIDLYRNFVDQSIRSFQLTGGVDVLFLQEVSWTSTYMAVLGGMVAADFALAYFILFRDGSGFKKLRAGAVGLSSGMGAMGVAMIYTTVSFASRGFGKALGAAGGAGGGGGGSPTPPPPNPPSPSIGTPLAANQDSYSPAPSSPTTSPPPNPGGFLS